MTHCLSEYDLMGFLPTYALRSGNAAGEEWITLIHLSIPSTGLLCPPSQKDNDKTPKCHLLPKQRAPHKPYKTPPTSYTTSPLPTPSHTSPPTPAKSPSLTQTSSSTNPHTSSHGAGHYPLLLAQRQIILEEMQ